MTADNMIVDYGGTNEITIYTVRVERTRVKKIPIIVPPQSTANKSEGPKTTKIIDLQRIEKRITVMGYINDSNADTFEAIFDAGGVFVVRWLNTSHIVNIEKLNIVCDDREDAHDDVQFTLIIGEDI